MIPLTSIRLTLTLSHTRQLFFFPVKLLNLPAVATLLLSGLCRSLRQIIGNYPAHAVVKTSTQNTFTLISRVDLWILINLPCTNSSPDYAIANPYS